MKPRLKRQDMPGLIILFIIGLALTFFAFTKLQKAAAAKNWPVTTGIVTGSQVSGAIKYYPSITYTYTVDTVVYNSNSISNVNWNTKNRSVAEDFIRKYPLESEIKVYYNSSKPSEAFLEPGVNPGNIIFLAVGLFLFLLPVLLVIFLKVDLKAGT